MKLLMPAISGLFSAASMNLDVLAARNFLPDALAVLQQEGDVSGCAYARQGRRRDHVRHAGGNLRVQLAFQPGGDAVRRHARGGAFGPWFQGNEEEGIGGALDGADEVEPVYGGDHFHAGIFPDDLFNPRGGGRRDVQGGIIRQFHAAEQVALVLIGKEAGGNELGEREEEGGHGGQQRGWKATCAG